MDLAVAGVANQMESELHKCANEEGRNALIRRWESMANGPERSRKARERRRARRS